MHGSEPGYIPDADTILNLYRSGRFPMADSRDTHELYVVDPRQRGVLPLDGLHVPRRLARTIRHAPYEVRIDTAFDAMVSLCAEAAPDRPETWINDALHQVYRDLHVRGQAHSVECWHGDELVGGLYGISLNGAFFGESMASRARDASKIALVYLVARLRVGGFALLDCQFMTDHLQQFGVIEITRAAYQRQLASALSGKADFSAMPPDMDGREILAAALP